MFWVIIFQEYKSLTHKPRSRWNRVMLQFAVIASLVQFALHLVQITDFAISKSPPHTHTHTITERPPSFTVNVTQGDLQLFHQLFNAHRSSHLTQRFWTLIRQFKGLFFTARLSGLYVFWPTGVFWHCFASSTTVSWQRFCHISQLHRVFSSHLMMTFFHDVVPIMQYTAFCHAS